MKTKLLILVVGATLFALGGFSSTAEAQSYSPRGYGSSYTPSSGSYGGTAGRSGCGLYGNRYDSGRYSSYPGRGQSHYDGNYGNSPRHGYLQSSPAVDRAYQRALEAQRNGGSSYPRGGSYPRSGYGRHDGNYGYGSYGNSPRHGYLQSSPAVDRAYQRAKEAQKNSYRPPSKY